MSGSLGRAAGELMCRYRTNLWRCSYARRCEWSALKQLMAIERGGSVLEVGAGNGWASLQMRSMGCSVTACDIASSRGLRESREFLRRRGIRLALADAQDLPFRDGAFDHVLSVCVLEHIPDAVGAMRECLRVLRAGGSFLFSVDSLPESLLGRELRDEHRERHSVRHTWSSKDLAGVGRQLGAADVVAQPILCSPQAVTELARRSSGSPGGRQSKLTSILNVPRRYLAARRIQRAEAAHAALSPEDGLMVVARMTK